MNDQIEPFQIPPHILNQLFLGPTGHGAMHIQEYLESQTGESPVHLELVATEQLFDEKVEVWDVSTNSNSYWVITNPTNYYSKEHFNSLDYTITFHVGLSTRIHARQFRSSPDETLDELASAWRKWERAAQTMLSAEDSVGFQAVGMQCRETLLTLINTLSNEDMIEKGQEIPKANSFIQWTDIMANHFAKGSSLKEIRRYMKTTAKLSWQLVNWLTHSTSAVRTDCKIALYATESVLNAYGEACFRHK